jgi:acetylglutamate kinase
MDTPTSQALRIVIKLGGSVVLDSEALAASAAEIMGLQQAGHTVVVVHGGGPQLDKELAALGEAVQKVDGLRVTSPAASDVVRNVMEHIGSNLCAKWSKAGLLCAHIGQAWEAFPATVKDERLGRVGTVEAFLAPETWPQGLPVITPVGYDGNGVLNINADEGACAVAVALYADWLILATDVSAVKGAAGESLGRLSVEQAHDLVERRVATGGMMPKLQNAVAALQGGVRHVLITRLGPGFATSLLAGNPEGTLIGGRAVPA